MGKINSKDKGARYEREVAAALRDYGYITRRTAQFCGNSGEAADVIGLPGIHIECKHVENMRLYDWIAQAVRDANAAGGTSLPVVIHRKNHAESLVTMRLDDWIKLYREYENGQ